MTPARPLKDVFADLLGDDGAARAGPDALLAASGHGGLPTHLVAEAVVNYADTAPVEVAEHLAPYVTTHSGVPVESPPDGGGVDGADPAGWAELLATAPGVAADAGTDPAAPDAGDLDRVVPSDDSGTFVAGDVPGDADVSGGGEWDEIDEGGNDLDGDARADDVAVIDFGGGADATGMSRAFDDGDGGRGRTESGDWTGDLGDGDGDGLDGVDGLRQTGGFDAAGGHALDDAAPAVSGPRDGSDVDVAGNGEADGDDPGDGLDG